LLAHELALHLVVSSDGAFLVGIRVFDFQFDKWTPS
jgi:hypothetical protein